MYTGFRAVYTKLAGVYTEISVFMFFGSLWCILGGLPCTHTIHRGCVFRFVFAWVFFFPGGGPARVKSFDFYVMPEVVSVDSGWALLRVDSGVCGRPELPAVFAPVWKQIRWCISKENVESH